MKKLYFRIDGEICATIDDHKEWMRENDIEQMEVILAERETGTGYFWCTHFFEVGEVGESCGKICDEYKPRNGKNGRCRNSGYLYALTEKRKIISTKS